jgi:hypothetical protein
MKAITIQQPWAWAVAMGHKRVENRTWRTSYRGPLLIHAGKSLERLADGLKWLNDFGITTPDEFIFGALIAQADLVDCVRVRQVRKMLFAQGPFCFILENVQPIRPVYCAGQSGLWTPSRRSASVERSTEEAQP